MNPYLFILLGIIGILCSPVWAADAPAAGVPPKDPYAAPASALSCPADAMVTSERCEGGICLTRAPGGVTGDSVTITGKASGSGLTGLLVTAQHDRTKAVATVNAAQALKSDGQFEVTVPLAQFGSHTVVIQAMRVGGNPMVIVARVSRVVAPHDLTASIVTIAEPKSGEDHIAIAVDLEKSCRDATKTGLPRECDLIGSRTGATMIEAVNRMASGREITRRTNAGSEGQFNLCMPLGDGNNAIEVRVCSPALPSCVSLTTKTIAFTKSEPQVRWIDSDPTRLHFAIDHWTPKKLPTAQCDGEIHVQWNHELKWNPETKKEDLVQIVCPANGEYRITSAPVVGVNELSISLPGETGREFHYTFGWGRAVWARDLAADAMGVNIDHMMLDRELPGLVNRFLESDEFPKLVQTMLTTSAAEKPSDIDTARLTDIAAIRGTIPACKVGKQSSTAMRVIGTPEVGKVHVNEIKLETDRIAMDLTLDDVVVQVQYFRDVDANGQPDETFLPLKIGFRRLQIRPRLVLATGSQLLLTSDEDDCLYKSASYCKHRPSIIQPRDFTGSIDVAGAFMKCDGDDQLVPAEIKAACESINNVDAKTGLVSEQILEAFNETLYCDVSAQLTYVLRHARIPVMQTFPVLGRKFSWKSELSLGAGGLSVGPGGIGVMLGSHVESPGFYYASGGISGNAAPGNHALGLMVREDVINQALAALVTLGNPGEGLLDWSLDEAAIGLLGFDFATQCDPASLKGEPPTLCQMRPTVEKLLGSDLYTSHYYAKEQPLRITVRGDRQLAPHLRFRVTADGEMVADLDIPNLEMSFAALSNDPSQAPTPIITARLTALVSLTLEKIATNPADPSQLTVKVRLRSKESRVAIMPVAGTNHTILPDHVLVGQLRSLMNWGLEEFGKPEKSIPPLTIPKKLETLFSRLGLAEILFGEGDLQWTIDPFAHALTLIADPQFVQRLLVNGQSREFVWGE